jgi:uncharacterized Zn finger protein
MRSIADNLSLDSIKNFATASNYRLGQQIVIEGKIDFIRFGPLYIVAKVSSTGKSSTRTVEMSSTPNGLVYKCTCSTKLKWFCKHCVAVGLACNAKEAKKK